MFIYIYIYIYIYICLNVFIDDCLYVCMNVYVYVFACLLEMSCPPSILIIRVECCKLEFSENVKVLIRAMNNIWVSKPYAIDVTNRDITTSHISSHNKPTEK